MNRLKGLVFLVLVALLQSTSFAKPDEPLSAVGHKNTWFLNQAQKIGPIPSTQKLDVVIWLKLKDQELLDKEVDDIYDPSSPNYQKFLTHEEFSERHEPDAKIFSAFKNYFTSLGFKSEEVFGQGLRIKGTAKQIQSLLNVSISQYNFHKRVVFSNDAAPKMPKDLQPLIRGITGLDDIAQAAPAIMASEYSKDNKTTEAKPLNFIWKGFMPGAAPTTTSLVNFGFTGKQLRHTYRINNIPKVAGQVLDGRGQTIVITLPCSKDTPEKMLSDANAYNLQNGLPLLNDSNIKFLKPDGTPFIGPCTSSNLETFVQEGTLDIDAVHTIAPEAKILFFTDKVNSNFALFDMLAGAINTLTKNNFTVAGSNGKAI